jgi:hypothetical protein
VRFSPPEEVLRGEDDSFKGIAVFRRGGFYVGLLHTLHTASGVTQPQWAWSHDGESWAATGIACIALGFVCLAAST